MATFKVHGITELTQEWQRAAQQSPALCKRMVEAGAEEATRILKRHIQIAGLVDTKKMIDNTKPTKIKEDVGGFSCEVYPQGKDKKGVKNVEKAFVNNYGTTGRVRKVPATHFFERATEEMATAVPAVMERVFDEEMGG